MPVSKKRKKKDGKKAKYTGSKIKVDPNRESAISFQDLINVLAAQEYAAGRYIPPAPEEDFDTVVQNTMVAEDVEVYMEDQIPVYVGEGPDRVQVGMAEREPGDDRVSITITDPDVVSKVMEDAGNYSIGEDLPDVCDDRGRSLKVLEIIAQHDKEHGE